ncbi:hypothetical protein CARUB_v10024473mg, partial [Capsella rubella]
ISRTADTLMFHIYMVGPKRRGTYSDSWVIDDFPECWEDHSLLGEDNGERCIDCIFYYLSRDIMLIS